MKSPLSMKRPHRYGKILSILIIILVVGVLGTLATLKYQSQKSDGVTLATEEVLEQDAIDERQQQDVAIVMVDEDTPDAAETEKTE